LSPKLKRKFIQKIVVQPRFMRT